MDPYCPRGPVLVTADELDPTALTLRVSVNGEPRQEASTGTLIFPLDVLVAELSLGMTLRAGDILLTGTPPGGGFPLEPHVFPRPGEPGGAGIHRSGRRE